MGKKDPDRNPEACVNCHCAVGPEPKVIPVVITDGDTREVWCPPCFAYVRKPMEPDRWHPHASMGPVLCCQCKKECLAIGARRCPQCGSRFVLDVPPRGSEAARA